MPSQQMLGGSRFGVLAAEGGQDGEANPVSVAAVVLFSVVHQADTRVLSKVSGSRGKKGRMKKRTGTTQREVEESSEKGIGRQALRKEKRMHDVIVPVEKNPDLLRLTYLEPKSERLSQFNCLSKIGFDGLTVIPSVGRSGGLVAAWRSSRIGVTVACTNRQYFHLRISTMDGRLVFLTAIYAIPSVPFKEALWDDLLSMAGEMSAPWLVVGDFNDIMVASERAGGVGVCYSRVRNFQQRIQACQLSDLGFQGPRFTWRGPRLASCSRLYESISIVLLCSLDSSSNFARSDIMAGEQDNHHTLKELGALDVNYQPLCIQYPNLQKDLINSFYDGLSPVDKGLVDASSGGAMSNKTLKKPET
ncbi:hypothetical protein K1719_004090 [Acacia pycnantha]|nr:hypothetical protein K1719_004090 [Acacia pycnantha]